ncbi:helix-turn-helix domain-containing protein [Pontibacter mangrovi]|uniref:AraC family transcriptional regulator n=1 Tax=Pontibacter mangrovi TaxID=2589816 RepID=A0A501W0Z2_9BACT|nr:helix-turn-helix domain-containing protein [Pontibacter mangrovi]TPE42948.1 AraC family transcriptional regulator [Pontibacter mangrovi]
MSLFALQVILVAGAVQGLLLSAILFTRKKNVLANRLLSMLILLVSFQSVLAGFDTREFFMAFPHLSKVGWLLPSLFGPLLFLFTKKLTSENPAWRRYEWLHFTPFFLIFLYLLPYYLQSAEAKMAYLDDFEKASEDDFGMLNQLLNLLHLSYGLAALLLIRRHEQRILHNFSEIRKVRLRWLKQFIRLVFFTILFGVTIFYARKWDLPFLTGFYHYHYLGVIICIYWIGYKALSQPAIFQRSLALTAVPRTAVVPEPEATEDTAPPVAVSAKYERSGLSEAAVDAYLLQLLEYMQEQKPYRNSDLTIQELAEAMGMAKHHLSRVINERLGKNFFEFVNEYRVNEAKRLLVHPDFSHYTTLAIAMEAGFNSKATFNAVFKKLTAMTPTAYAAQEKASAAHPA